MGWLRSEERPSIVITFFPATVAIAAPHERVATPLIWTVQAPHSCTPQPNLVPVMPSVSRKTHSNGICGETSTLCRFPLRVNSMAGIWIPPQEFRKYTLSVRFGATVRFSYFASNMEDLHAVKSAIDEEYS